MLLNRKFKNSSTQTGEPSSDLFIYLTNKKTIRVYFSSSYKANVLSFNFGSSKSFIFTREMWNIFKHHINDIDNILNKEST